MPPLILRIEREVLEGKQRTKNRIREHSGLGHDEWDWLREIGKISLITCSCGWTGWLPTAEIDHLEKLV